MEAKRARRIRQTLTVAARRRFDHLRTVHNGDTSTVACVCELANTYFAKRTALQCDCRRRRPGRPRQWTGLCSNGWRRDLYRERAVSRQLRESARAGRWR